VEFARRECIRITLSVPDRYSLAAEEAEAELLWLQKLLPGITADEIKQLSFGAERLTYYAGEAICRQGDELEHVFLVSRGKVDIWTESDGQRVPITGYRGSFWIGEVELVTEEACLATVAAVATSVVYRVDGQRFRQLLRSNPDVCYALFEEACYKSARRVDKFRLMWRPVSLQLAAAIQEPLRTKRFPTRELSQDLVELTVSQEELADSIGYAQATVARALQKLQEKSIVTKQGHGRLVLNRLTLEQEIASGSWD